jgi:hypothetical protein
MTTPPPSQFRSQSEMIQYLSMLEGRISELEDQNQRQISIIEDLRTQPQPVTTVERPPKTNLLHPHFLRRAFTVWGHWFVAQFTIGLIIAIIYLVVLLIFIASGNYLFTQ